MLHLLDNLRTVDIVRPVLEPSPANVNATCLVPPAFVVPLQSIDHTHSHLDLSTGGHVVIVYNDNNDGDNSNDDDDNGGNYK